MSGGFRRNRPRYENGKKVPDMSKKAQTKISDAWQVPDVEEVK